jgi:hypothetical protein
MAQTIRVKWIVAAAGRIGAKTGMTGLEVLQTIQDAIFQNDIKDGRVLIGSTETGASQSFAIPPGHTPMEIGDLIQAAIDSIEGRPNFRRMRVSFSKAQL